jgi:hypothetical protein
MQGTALVGLSGLVVGASIVGGALGAARPLGALVQLPRATVCDEETGVQRCKRVRALQGPIALAFSADGRSLYAGVEASGALVTFRRAPQTGALTQPPGPAGCLSEWDEHCGQMWPLVSAQAILVPADGRYVYVAADQRDAVTTFVRDRRKGTLRPLTKNGCITVDRDQEECNYARLLGQIHDAELSRDGRNLYVAGNDGLAIFRRDPGTGALTQLAGIDGCVSEDGTDPYRVRHDEEDRDEIV